MFVVYKHAHCNLAMYITHVYTLENVSHIYIGLFRELILASLHWANNMPKSKNKKISNDRSKST